MSQITTIDQCKVGMTVYHPLLGKGEITMVMYKGCNVRFKDVNGQSRGKIFNEDPDSLISNISHLFTEPVYICEKCEHRYEPIKLQS